MIAGIESASRGKQSKAKLYAHGSVVVWVDTIAACIGNSNVVTCVYCSRLLGRPSKHLRTAFVRAEKQGEGRGVDINLWGRVKLGKRLHGHISLVILWLTASMLIGRIA